jgi:RNA polymerase sigma-70 factor (ECF subfamily)
MIPIDEVPLAAGKDHAAADDKDVRLLYRCIQELPKLDRAVILLHLEQKCYREISEVTGLSEGSVSVRIVRIKQKLRGRLQERG